MSGILDPRIPTFQNSGPAGEMCEYYSNGGYLRPPSSHPPISQKEKNDRVDIGGVTQYEGIFYLKGAPLNPELLESCKIQVYPNNIGNSREWHYLSETERLCMWMAA